MRYQVSHVYHRRVRNIGFASQTIHHPGECPFFTPPLPTIVEGLSRAIVLWRVAPSQPVATDENYSLHHPPTINTRLALALGKEELEPRGLRIGQPEEGCSLVSLLTKVNHSADVRRMDPDPSFRWTNYRGPQQFRESYAMLASVTSFDDLHRGKLVGNRDAARVAELAERIDGDPRELVLPLQSSPQWLDHKPGADPGSMSALRGREPCEWLQEHTSAMTSF